MYEDQDDDDRDAPQDMDLERQEADDQAGQRPCPSCRRMVHELAAMCPYCGQWMEDDSPAAQRARGWFWPLMVAALIATILVIRLGLGR